MPGEEDGDGLGLGPPLLEEGEPQQPHQHITGPGLPPPPPPRLANTNEAQRRCRVPPLEVHAIKALSARANVLPVLARTDTLGEARLREVKRAVRRDLAKVGIGFGIFDVEGEEEGVEGGEGEVVGGEGERRGAEGEEVPWGVREERVEVEMRGKEERETGEEGLSVGGGVRSEWFEPAPGMDVDSARPQLHTLKIAKSPLGVGGSASSPTSASASASVPPTIVTSTSTSTSTGATITTATTATTSQSQSQSQSQVQTSASALGLPTPTSTVSTSAAGGSGGAGGLGGGNAGGGAGGGAHRWSTSSSITAVTASSPTSPMYANPPSSSSSTQRGWKTNMNAKAASALNMNLTPRELLLQSAQMHRPRAGTVYLGGDGRAHHDYPYSTDAEVEAEAVNANAHYVQVHAEVAPPLARKPLRIPVPALPHAVAAPDAYAHGEGVPARWIPFSAASSSSSSNPSSSAYLAELVKRYTALAPGEHPGKLSGEDRGRDRDECEGEPGAHTDAPSPHAHTSIHTPAWIREARLGKFTRQFRWGALDILNTAHCDFVPLRRAVFECMTVRSLLFF